MFVEGARPIGRTPYRESPGQPGGDGRKDPEGRKPLRSLVRPCPVRDCRRRFAGLIRKACTDGEDRISKRLAAAHGAEGHRFEPSQPEVAPVAGACRGQGREASFRTFSVLQAEIRPGGMCNRRTILGFRQPERAQWTGQQKLISSRRSTACSQQSAVVVVAHYKGLTVADMQKLRSQMKQAGATVKVAKNSLAKHRSRWHGRRLHQAPPEGPDPARLFERSGRGRQGRGRFRQGQRQARDPRRRDGCDRPEPGRREGPRHAAVPRRTARQARGPRPGPATKIAQVVNAPAAKLARVFGAYAKQGRSGLRPYPFKPIPFEPISEGI